MNHKINMRLRGLRCLIYHPHSYLLSKETATFTHTVKLKPRKFHVMAQLGRDLFPTLTDLNELNNL